MNFVHLMLKKMVDHHVLQKCLEDTITTITITITTMATMEHLPLLTIRKLELASQVQTAVFFPNFGHPGVPRHYDDESHHLKKIEVETVKVVRPWPALHINTNKGEEKKTSERNFHPPPLSPSSIPEHLKCNILKAQAEAVFRESAQVEKEDTSLLNSPLLSPTNITSLQDLNGRSPPPVQPEALRASSVPEKQEVKPPRVRRLTRQYSFDEDDLPPALAAAVGASPPLSSASPASQKTTSEGQFFLCPKSPTNAGSSFALEPGDLLMDFTEATPLIKTFPAATSNPFFDPFPTLPQFSAGFRDNKLQCCVVLSSPKTLSPVIPRSLVENMPTPTVQIIHSSHKPISLTDSAEPLRHELEREKMMKRLLMTEL